MRHVEVRLCIVQLSCVCPWTNGKKTTNKKGTMLVYNVHVMYILSHVENWEYLQIQYIKKRFSTTACVTCAVGELPTASSLSGARVYCGC